MKTSSFTTIAPTLIFAVTALILIAVLAGFITGCSPSGEQPASQDLLGSTSPEETVPTSLPSEDVSGEDIPDLPRYPDSVRFEYELVEEEDSTRVVYLTTDEVDTIRQFYRDTFQSEGWTEADTDFSGGVWTFFVTKDGREATVTIEPHDSLVEVEIELNEPQPGEETAPEPAQPTPETSPSPSPAPQSAPEPAPAPAPAPAPIPGNDFDDDFDDGDD